jgi:2-polyprenyl-6-methoxyphenol hydroxylase-like FAD-dependent oxidoreductase
MTKRGKFLTAGIAALALAAGGVGVAVAGGEDDAEAPIRGSALDKASVAALEHTGGGRVTETEAGDEESYYEVEVTRDDGSQVDVQLDRGFDVVGGSADDENEDESGDDD